jgi:hypothetical protein
VKDTFPEWLWDAVAVEQAEEHLHSALMKLRSVKGEVTLTDSERRALLHAPAKGKRARGRPAADAISIALDCQIYEAFWPIKVAVEVIAKRHGVSRAAVYAARRKFSLGV